MFSDTASKINDVSANANNVVTDPKIPKTKPIKEESESNAAIPPLADKGGEISNENVGDMEPDSVVLPHDKTHEEHKETQTGQEVQKKKQLPTNIISTTETIKVGDNAVVSVMSEHDQLAKPQEAKIVDKPITKIKSDKKVEENTLTSSNVVDLASTPTPNEIIVDNADNGKNINDDGGSIVMSDEDNNENRDFMERNDGADGLDREGMCVL